MAKNLVIVESPAKAKTIQKFLGKDFEVKACMGHVRDLPRTKLGIDIDRDFSPNYMIIPGKKKLIEELLSSSKKASKIFLATDLDREGEAIAWHLLEALKIGKDKAFRVIFNEITKKAIQNSFQNTTQIQMSKVNAQQARRILDRIVGYLLSPLLWKKFTMGLSAGRVQSVAVKLISDKELEIREFKSEEYWKITATLSSKREDIKDSKFEAELKKEKDAKIVIKNEQEAKEIVSNLQKLPFIVGKISRKEKKEPAPPPFTTSLLQQQASIQLGFRTKLTMLIAQQLYEGLDIGSEGPVGLITYMRTDSFSISDEAQKECLEWIESKFSKQYLPSKPNVHKSKNSQGAHEAIRPTSVNRIPDQIKSFLSPDQYKLYKLIWTRFVASQMAEARVCVTDVHTLTGDYLFESKGKEILFPGYQILYPKASEEEKILPNLKEKEELQVHDLKPSQHFTQPPPRYSEATLVKALETKGIGRPSTYSPIITTIQERGYVKLEDKKFWATELGIKVTKQLEQYFPKIMDFGFTSEMENNLDKVEEDTVNWVNLIKEFYTFFASDLKNAYDKMESIKQNPEVSEYKCSICGSPMVYKYNKMGKFLGCSQFPKCKNSLPITMDGKPIFPKETNYTCHRCGSPMIMRKGPKGNFLGCSNYPDCKTSVPIGIDGKPIFPELAPELCPKCNSSLVKRKGINSSFYGCSQYPNCSYIQPIDNDCQLKKILEVYCDKCSKPMLLRKGKKGLFLGCSGYPDCNNIQRFSVTMLKFPKDFQNPSCPNCSEKLILKFGSKGIFWACSKYPECNFTQTTSLEEIANMLP